MRVALPEGVKHAVPLAPYTSLGIGGAAEYFANVRSEKQLLTLLAYAKTQGLPVHVLGGGSNVVIADAGVTGLVLQLCIKGKSACSEGNTTRLSAMAGEDWDALVAYTVDQRWSGLECLAGIPGLVGATPIQNVGAYGQEVSDTISRVRVLDRQSLQSRDWSAEDCKFSYRHSRFKEEADRYVVLEVEFILKTKGVPTIRYAELQGRLKNRDVLDVQAVRDAVLELRASKGMYIKSPVYEPSAGSFFTNPVLSKEEYELLVKKMVQTPPIFDLPDGRKKIPAAWLIEACGFYKGQRFGEVGISKHHALSLVNLGAASSAALHGVAQHIMAEVKRCFGVQLRPEPCFWGEERAEPPGR